MGKKSSVVGEDKKKTRWFCITVWDMDCDFQKIIDQGQIRYIKAGREVCPNEGTLHWQTWCYFHNPRGKGKRALNEIGKMWGNIHANVEPMFGNMEQNDAYCEKDKDWYEYGEKPEQGRRADIEVVRDNIMNGNMTADDVCVENPEFFHQYGRTLDRLEGISLRKKFRTWMTKGIWYTGGAGKGKSHAVFEGFDPDTHYVKNLNEDWWDGYKGQEIVILNEFRSQITFSELLDLCDKWPKTVKWRNREPVPFLAKEIRVASIKHPREAYLNALIEDEPWEQFERRFTIIDLEQKCSEGNNGTSEPLRAGNLASISPYLNKSPAGDYQVGTASNSDAEIESLLDVDFS